MNPEDYNDALPRIKRYQERQDNVRFAVFGFFLLWAFVAFLIVASN